MGSITPGAMPWTILMFEVARKGGVVSSYKVQYGVY